MWPHLLYVWPIHQFIGLITNILSMMSEGQKIRVVLSLTALTAMALCQLNGAM